MATTVFEEPWFYHRSTHGIGRALHGTVEERQASEHEFLSHLCLSLLDRQKDPEFAHDELLSFFGFCQRTLPRSSSQILQDLWVLYRTGEKREGFFVEFGACDGLALSNSVLLEREYGWRGILAEPNPTWHEALRANRTCEISTKCVHWRGGETVKFEHTPKMPELSRLEEIVPDDVHEGNGNRANAATIDVETITLNELLVEHDAPEVIDYLSIDTEGSEFEILSAFDFSAHDVRLITVEHAGETAKRAAILDLLKGQGFHRWRPELTRWDDWYIKEVSTDHGP